MTTATIIDETPGQGRVSRFEIDLGGARVTAREIIRERVLVEHGTWRSRGHEARTAGEARGATPEVAEAVWLLASGGPPPEDPEAAVRAALNGFEAGRFVLLVGERQAETLDEPLALGAESEIVFLRLMPLRGG